MYYVEWAPTVQRRKGLMVSLPGLTNILKLRDPGYSSVYLFSEVDALAVKQSRNSKGLDKFEVSSTFLVLDIDTGDTGLAEVTASLDSKQLAYEIWSSGSKGYHVYIPHRFITSKHLPYSHKCAALSLVPKELIDITLYQHGRLLSLPGRIHPKTRNKKTLIRSVLGKWLEVPILEEPIEAVSNFRLSGSSDEEKLFAGLSRVLDLLVYPPESGKRHIRLWGTAKDLADSGLQYETALDLMERINETWNNPKTHIELEQAVRAAFSMPKSE